MKEYKLKINGNDYNVTITDIEDTIAEVEVNGIPFKVEIDRPLKKQAPVVQRPAATVGQNSAPKPTASAMLPVPASNL